MRGELIREKLRRGERVYGTHVCSLGNPLAARFQDTFHAFKAQLEAFVRYLRTGELPFAFEQTAELMKIIIAGICSREGSGRTVMFSEIAA